MNREPTTVRLQLLVAGVIWTNHHVIGESMRMLDALRGSKVEPLDNSIFTVANFR